MISEILKIFYFRTYSADAKYSLPNRENLRQPIQMQLSKKQKISSEIFAPLLKSIPNFEHFENKYDPHSLCISEIMNCKRRCEKSPVS